MTKEELMQFEDEIKEVFLQGKIWAPVHFSRGNEDDLIEIFKEVGPHDWVFSTHRSHYHALLKGIPREWVKQEILEGRSIHMNNKEHNFFTSAIVSGCLPIALGVAMAIKFRCERSRRVWVFIGDMAAETGMFHECTKYAARNNLPLVFVIEDNGLSVNTPTQESWGTDYGKADIRRYHYIREWPHIGLGQWVTFG